MNEDTRILPQAVELEEAVLGGFLCDFLTEQSLNALDFLTPEMFYNDFHQLVFGAIIEMKEAGEVVDILTVTNWMHERKAFDKVGLTPAEGAYQISVLTNRVATSQNIEFHSRIIVQKWVLRKIILFGSLAVNRSYNDDPDIFGVLDDVRELVLLEDKLVKQGSEVQVIGNIIGKETEDYDNRAAADQRNEITGVHTGFNIIDNFTMGWQKSDLIIVAARPSMGKTAWVTQIAVEAAIKRTPVLFYSLEMSELQLLQRILTGKSELDNEQYKRGRLNPMQIQELNKARDIIRQIPLYIDDTASISITEMRSKSRRMKTKHGIGLIVVDYLQLMRGTKATTRTGQREQEVARIARGLKILAKELDVPVIALSQLSRANEQRADKRPQLSDLRESGAIEQDSDSVIFIHRPEYYGEFTNSEGESTRGKAEIIFSKHRNGKIGTIELNWVGEYTRFYDRSSNQFGGINPNQQFLNNSF